MHSIQFTPRVHLRWSPIDKTSLRLSAGRGFRSARVLGENISLMASSRMFNIAEDPGEENDLAGENPDKVAELEELLQGARTESEVFSFR